MLHWAYAHVLGRYDRPMIFQQLLVDDAGHDYSAPYYWMSEFGTDTEYSEKYQKIIRLPRENDADFAYWSVHMHGRPQVVGTKAVWGSTSIQ